MPIVVFQEMETLILNNLFYTGRSSLFIILILFMSSIASHAEDTQAPIHGTIEQKFLYWVDREKAEEDLFSYLVEKSRDKRNVKSSSYGEISNKLKEASGLLNSANLPEKKIGLQAVLSINHTVLYDIGDKKLSCLLLESFVLPNIQLISSNRWNKPNKPQIVIEALDAFKDSNEIEKRISLFRLLFILDISQDTRDINRAGLAQVLADNKDYGEAIALLRQISTKGAEPFKKLIPEYERALNDQKDR